jgi:hypothetical protein
MESMNPALPGVKILVIASVAKGYNLDTELCFIKHMQPATWLHDLEALWLRDTPVKIFNFDLDQLW